MPTYSTVTLYCIQLSFIKFINKIYTNISINIIHYYTERFYGYFRKDQKNNDRSLRKLK